MKPKYILFLIFTLIAVTVTNAQVAVANTITKRCRNIRNYDELKDKKTIFVANGFQVEDVEQIMKEVWKVNDYEVISQSDFEKDFINYIDTKYAIIDLNRTIVYDSYRNPECTRVYLHYYIPIKVKKKNNELIKWKKKEVAALYFDGTGQWFTDIPVISAKNNPVELLYNYNLGFIKNYLQFINAEIQQKADWSLFYPLADDELKALKTAPLYIPEYVLQDDPFSKEKMTTEKLLQDYSFKYEWVTAAQLSDKIVQGSNEDFYYYSSIFIGKVGKIVSVVNGRTGKLVYVDRVTLTFGNAHHKDFKLLAKAIAKIEN